VPRPQGRGWTSRSQDARFGPRWRAARRLRVRSRSRSHAGMDSSGSAPPTQRVGGWRADPRRGARVVEGQNCPGGKGTPSPRVRAVADRAHELVDLAFAIFEPAFPELLGEPPARRAAAAVDAWCSRCLELRTTMKKMNEKANAITAKNTSASLLPRERGRRADGQIHRSRSGNHSAQVKGTPDPSARARSSAQVLMGESIVRGVCGRRSSPTGVEDIVRMNPPPGLRARIARISTQRRQPDRISRISTCACAVDREVPAISAPSSRGSRAQSERRRPPSPGFGNSAHRERLVM